jgi:methylthioribose-1-phosphate isomerase
MGVVAKYLVDMFPQNGNVMTQCFGETIVGMMLKEAKNQNKNIKLFCPETRPYLQGARLTASVAYDQGFDVTVITDNMPAFTMKNKNIDVFTSAADSICLDGHIVNKVGTLQIAIVAKYFEVPYFVTGIPDKDYTNISQVKIEERDPNQVLEFRGIKNTLDGVKGYYPSFDITPPHLVSGVVTDKGIFSPYDLHRYFDSDVEKFY